jgi:GTP-binding protein
MIPATSEDPRGEYDILLGELEKYNPELLDKARVVAVSKSDVLDSERMEEIEKVLPDGVPHVFISSVTGQGLVMLKDILWEVLDVENRKKSLTAFEEEEEDMLGFGAGELLGDYE